MSGSQHQQPEVLAAAAAGVAASTAAATAAACSAADSAQMLQPGSQSGSQPSQPMEVEQPQQPGGTRAEGAGPCLGSLESVALGEEAPNENAMLRQGQRGPSQEGSDPVRTSLRTAASRELSASGMHWLEFWPPQRFVWSGWAGTCCGLPGTELMNGHLRCALILPTQNDKHL